MILVQVTNHPEHGTFDAELVVAQSGWPWWLVRRLDGDGSARDFIGVHASLVTDKED